MSLHMQRINIQVQVTVLPKVRNYKIFLQECDLHGNYCNNSTVKCEQCWSVNVKKKKISFNHLLSFFTVGVWWISLFVSFLIFFLNCSIFLFKAVCVKNGTSTYFIKSPLFISRKSSLRTHSCDYIYIDSSLRKIPVFLSASLETFHCCCFFPECVGSILSTSRLMV